MKNILTTILLTVLIGVTFSCSEDDSSLELLENNELEVGSGKPVGWTSFFNSINAESSFELDWSTDEAISGERSLKIEIESADPDEFAAWVNTVLIDSEALEGQKVRLSAWVKGDMQGTGVIMILRGEQSGEELTFETTQFERPLTGDFNWRRLSLTTTIESGVDSYSIFLMLSGSTFGEVFFDDISFKLQ